MDKTKVGVASRNDSIALRSTFSTATLPLPGLKFLPGLPCPLADAFPLPPPFPCPSLCLEGASCVSQHIIKSVRARDIQWIKQRTALATALATAALPFGLWQKALQEAASLD